MSNSLTITELKKIPFSTLVDLELKKDPKALQTIASLKEKLTLLFKAKNFDLTADRFWRVLTIGFQKNPSHFGHLNTYDVLLCCMLAAECGYYISEQDQVYLYERNRRPFLHIGYHALARMAIKNGIITTLSCGIKYIGDELDFDEEKGLKHKILNEEIAYKFHEFSAIDNPKEAFEVLKSFVHYPYCYFVLDGVKTFVPLAGWTSVVEETIPMKKTASAFWKFPEPMLQKMAIRRALTQVISCHPKNNENINAIINTLNLEEGIVNLDDVETEMKFKLDCAQEISLKESHEEVKKDPLLNSLFEVKMQSQEDIEETYKILGI